MIRRDVVVDSLAALQMLHVSELEEGTSAWVTQQIDYYILQKNSSAVVGGTNVVAPVAGSSIAGAPNAKWVLSSVVASAQRAADAATTDWYVSATGNSSASGTDAGHPIPPSELSRRLSGLTLTVAGLMTVHYDAAGDPAGGLVISWTMATATQMLVIGTPTSTGTTGTLTTWVTIDNTTTPKSYGFEDTALPAANSWSAFVGVPSVSAPKRIRITLGPRVGLCMAVLKDENTNSVPVPKTARVAPPYSNPSFAYPIAFYTPVLTVPVAGDPYVVESLPNIGWVRNSGVNVNSTAQIFFKDVAFTPLAGTSVSVASGEFSGFYDCHQPWIVSVGPTAIYGGSSDYAEVRTGLFQATGVGILFGWELYSGSFSDIANCLFQGAYFKTYYGARMSCSSGIQIFDTASTPLIVLGWAFFAILSGDNNGSFPVVNNGGRLVWNVVPTIQNNVGVNSAISVDGVQFPWGNGIVFDKTTGSNVHQNGVSSQQGADVLSTWSADASLTNAAAQYIPRSALVTQLAQCAGVMQAAQRYVNKLDVAFQGNAGNVAGQTVTIKIQVSTDHGATFSDLTGATSGALGTTAGAKHSEVSFSPAVLVAEGSILLAIATPSAVLTAAVTGIAVGLK